MVLVLIALIPKFALLYLSLFCLTNKKKQQMAESVTSTHRHTLDREPPLPIIYRPEHSFSLAQQKTY